MSCGRCGSLPPLPDRKVVGILTIRLLPRGADMASVSLHVADEGNGRSVDFGDFYENWQPRLLSYVRRAFGVRDADEVTQEALARAYQSIDLSSGAGRQWRWLTVVARNIATDLARERGHCDVADDPTGIPDAPYQQYDDPERQLVERECVERLSRALAPLPPHQRRAWWLVIVDGMTATDAGQRLGVSGPSVRQAMFKSRPRLAESLRDLNDRLQGLVPLPALLAMQRLRHALARKTSQVDPRLVSFGELTSVVLAVAGVTLTVAASLSPATSVRHLRPALVTTAANQSTARTSTARAHHGGGELHAATTSAVASRPAGPDDNAVHHGVYLSPRPFAEGKAASADVEIPTPIGTVVVDENVLNGPGGGVICTVAARVVVCR